MLKYKNMEIMLQLWDYGETTSEVSCTAFIFMMKEGFSCLRGDAMQIHRVDLRKKMGLIQGQREEVYIQ